MKKAKVMIVDDHEVVRSGLSFLLSQYDYLEVVGTAETIEEAFLLMEKHHPRIVLMDVRLKKDCGIECCREIVERYPETKVIMLTSYGNDEVILNAIRAGANGFVLKDTGNDGLIRAIDAAIRGESMLDPVITNTLLSHLRRGQDAGQKTKLSNQEKKVLALLSEGFTNKEIAREIFLSEKTVRNYVCSILSKLSLNNRAEAAVYAVDNKLIEQATDKHH